MISPFHKGFIFIHENKTLAKISNSTVYKPLHDKNIKIACVPSKDSDQIGHAHSLIRVYALRNHESLATQWMLSSDSHLKVFMCRWVDYSLWWAHRSFYWSCHALAQLICYRAIALISVNIVSNRNIEGRKSALILRNSNSGQYSPISFYYIAINIWHNFW